MQTAGALSSMWIRATSAPRKWKLCWVIHKGARKAGLVRGGDFHELVAEMVASDLEEAKRDALVAKEGFKVYNHHE